MSKKKMTIILVITLLSIALIQVVRAQATDEPKMFFLEKFEGISVGVNATREVLPGQNMTIKLWINCTSDDVTMNDLNLSVYGFRSGREKISLSNFTSFSEATPLVYHQTTECNYTVIVPSDVWDATYAELCFSYATVDNDHTVRRSFSMTLVRNVYLENLEQQYSSLNASYQQLNSTFSELNETYWDLKQNYTDLQGITNTLDNTRIVTVILAITTAFFVVITIFLIMRKPKEYW
jgi:hypothetical protein